MYSIVISFFLILFSQGHKDSVTCTAFNHDGKFVATGDMSGFIIVWDVATKKEVWSFEATDLEVRGIWCYNWLNFLEQAIIKATYFLNKKKGLEKLLLIVTKLKCWSVDVRLSKICLLLKFIFTYGHLVKNCPNFSEQCKLPITYESGQAGIFVNIQSVSLSVCLFVCLSVCLSPVHLSVRQSVSQPGCLSLAVCTSFSFLSIHASVCLSVHLFILLYIHSLTHLPILPCIDQLIHPHFLCHFNHCENSFEVVFPIIVLM